MTLLTEAPLLWPTLVEVLIERASSAIGNPGIAVPYGPSVLSLVVKPNSPVLETGESTSCIRGLSEMTGVTDTRGGAGALEIAFGTTLNVPLLSMIRVWPSGVGVAILLAGGGAGLEDGAAANGLRILDNKEET
jgi:hypothetical protein